MVSSSTKEVVSTNGSGGQDGGHRNECEEQSEAPHVEEKSTMLRGQILIVGLVDIGLEIGTVFTECPITPCGASEEASSASNTEGASSHGLKKRHLGRSEASDSSQECVRSGERNIWASDHAKLYGTSKLYVE